MSKTKQKDGNKTSVVKPLIRVEGQNHVLEDLFDGDPDDMPLMTSIGFMRLSPQSNTWISYIIVTRGKEVISIEVDEPNLRAIAEESAKINFVNSFIDQE